MSSRHDHLRVDPDPRLGEALRRRLHAQLAGASQDRDAERPSVEPASHEGDAVALITVEQPGEFATRPSRRTLLTIAAVLIVISGIATTAIVRNATTRQTIDPAATASPIATTATTPAPPPSTTAAAAAPIATTTYHSPQNAFFPLPLAFAHGPEWAVQVGQHAIDIVHEGDPSTPDQPWGSGIVLLDGALVNDPANVISSEPALADKSTFIPFPNDYFVYITALPGVQTLAGPRPVTIGGVKGTQLIVQTPAMRPTLWLANDYTWLGGGRNGVDPELKRMMILLEVNGQKVLLEFDDNLTSFDQHLSAVQQIFGTITFAPSEPGIHQVITAAVP